MLVEWVKVNHGDKMAAKELNAIIADTVFLTSETMILRVIPDNWEIPDYSPGQFTVLGLPASTPRVDISDEEEGSHPPEKTIMRSYSIASSSHAKEYLEFYISLVRSGSLTPRLFSLQRGDRIFMRPKISGMFTLDEIPKESNLIFIGTGTGIAPYMSMIRTFIRPDDNRSLTVIHGARHSWDLGYSSELSTLNNMLPNFHYIPAITRPESEVIKWGGTTGYIQEIWQSGIADSNWGTKASPDNTHIFLCGNPTMVEEMAALLASEGYPEHKKREPGLVHLERYW
jgi:ferredoxin/flavodoxin---NADP+ reductase